ncbi:hypothetical protein [Ochrobactrum sp. BTU1]|uniref:hypothetical protein n=1 Tax=Ochrobactrum sp. BTU1 TaxID=2840456 RepID=UPI001C03AE9A|nr:hypothetical protein KMS41_24880 [Ochrobactrum sp. BTU1]
MALARELPLLEKEGSKKTPAAGAKPGRAGLIVTPHLRKIIMAQIVGTAKAEPVLGNLNDFIKRDR